MSLQETLDRSEMLRRERHYDTGIQLLMDALVQHRDNARIYYRLGNLYYDKGDLERAEFCFHRAVECDPAHADALNNLAVVYRRQGKVGMSIRTLKRMHRGAFDPERSPGRRANPCLGVRWRVREVLGWAVPLVVLGAVLYFLLHR